MSIVARVTQSFEILKVLKPKLKATLAIGGATSPVFTHRNTAMSTFLLCFYRDSFAPTTYGCSNLTNTASHKASRSLTLQNAVSSPCGFEYFSPVGFGCSNDSTDSSRIVQASR